MSRVGIFGGSFNPPHIGHLICARSAAEQLGLETVFIVPLNEPSHRTLEDDPGPQARLELCRLAVAGDDVLQASDLEVARGGVSYTVETIEEMVSGGAAREPVLVLGADAALGLPGWRDPERILELATLAIAPRGGEPVDSVGGQLASRFPGARVETFEMPGIGISSSGLRQRIADGLTVRDMVPPAVAERIAREGLYGAGSAG